MNTAFAFDLDGTITKAELLPLIARHADLEDEIGYLTKLTIDGVIPFEQSFKLRFAILRSIRNEIIQNAVADVELDPYIAKFIKERPDHCYVVTGNISHWIQPLLDQLGCGSYASHASLEDGYCRKLTHINLKSLAIADMRRKHGRIVAIGEGANDALMFEPADISVCYGGVHPPCSDLYDYANYCVFDGKKLCDLLSTL